MTEKCSQDSLNRNRKGFWDEIQVVPVQNL